ncbi:MAG: hypothetical protein ACRDD1_15490, partial [Planctomycetia bacterium]
RLLAAHAAATWYMVGVLWFVQLVHYPLMAAVGPDEFLSYERLHQAAVVWVVGPGMLVEGATAALVAHRTRRWEPWRRRLAWFGVALYGALFSATFLIYAPWHEELARRAGEGFDAAGLAAAAGALAAANWWRTAGWTVRGAVAFLLSLDGRAS